MNEERIVLPDFIIADIYKNHLIEPSNKLTEDSIPDQSAKKSMLQEAKEKKASLKFLGKNKKRVIVLISEEQAPFINDDELAFLTKVLNACNFNLADIAIVNTYTNKTTFDQLRRELSAEHILLLGVEPASIQLPFTMPKYQVQSFSNCTIISAPALSTMLADSAENILQKRQLWTSLQKAFNLN